MPCGGGSTFTLGGRRKRESRGTSPRWSQESRRREKKINHFQESTPKNEFDEGFLKRGGLKAGKGLAFFLTILSQGGGREKKGHHPSPRGKGGL